MRAMVRQPAGRRCAAFTLLEVTIVVFIIAVTASIALPRYDRSLARFRADAAAKRVQLDLELTRKLAITASRQHRFRLITGTNKYIIEKSSDGGTTWTSVPHVDLPGKGAYQVDMGVAPYQAKLSPWPAASTFTIVFDGFGKPSQTVGLKLKAGVESRLVTIDAATSNITTGMFTTGVEVGGVEAMGL